MSKQNKKKQNKKIQRLTALVLTALALGDTLFSAPVYAKDESVISTAAGAEMFRVQYYGASDNLSDKEKSLWQSYMAESLPYDLTAAMQGSLNRAFQQWADILGAGANMQQSAQYLVGTSSRQNASATAVVYKDGKQDDSTALFRGIFQKGGTVNAVTPANYEDTGTYAFGVIIIGQNIGINAGDGQYGFAAEPVGQLTNLDGQIPLTVTMFHEIGHSLGIKEDLTIDIVNNGFLCHFDERADEENSFTSYLVDRNGTHPRAGMEIITSDEFQARLAQDATLNASDYFIVDNDAAGGEHGYRVFFVGKNVLEVLGDAKFGAQSGLPLNARENGLPDFSHLELARSMLSHQNYRSYTTLMEAELALMQDLGYDIDRRAHYGKSIYTSGGKNNRASITNYNGYSARNAAGTAYTGEYSTVPLGVGLHVYGSYNDVTQAADILTKGEGAAGIRVDGIEDSITVAAGTEVHADGTNGEGILIAYGKNHVVNVDGTVTALGEGGNAIECNFGANSYNDNVDYRGSYLRYHRILDADTGKVILGSNLSFTAPTDADSGVSHDITDQEEGDLNSQMATININGTVKGAGNAIHIAKNAFVDKINIGDGAELVGNITSEWKHFETADRLYDGTLDGGKDALRIQYGDKVGDDGYYVMNDDGDLIYFSNRLGYDYDAYIPDLVTDLNFTCSGLSYASNIEGRDNMKLNVSSGTLTYGGTANVVNVNVASGATLLGGSYQVNDMSKKMAAGLSDDNTGKFINHGTIGAADGNGVMKIEGNLVSDGALQAYAGGEAGYIDVSGAANVANSTVTVANADALLPGESLTVLKAAQGVTGGLTNGSEAGAKAVSGLLSVYGTIDTASSTVTATTISSNNLADSTPWQNEVYEAVSSKAAQAGSLGANEQRELRELYAMDAEGVKKAFNSLASEDRPADNLSSVAQLNSATGRIISGRLHEVFSVSPVLLSVGGSHLADGDNASVEVPMHMPLPKEESAWVKFGKHWGDLRSGSNFHSSATTLGYDWARGPFGRDGVFISYGESALGGNGNENFYDTRVGYYSGTQRGADESYWYADIGFLKGKTARVRSFTGTPKLVTGKYSGNIYELGGEWKHDLHYADGRVWHVSPYVGANMSYLHQGGYTEEGSLAALRMDGYNNFYAALETGVELKRYVGGSNYAFRFGVQQALCGADAEQDAYSTLVSGRHYTLSSRQDKTHFLAGLSGDAEVARGWHVAGELCWQKGAHDRDISAQVMLKRIW